MSNWLTAIALLLPALRLLRIARLAQLLRVTRVARGLRLVRVVGSLNRGMKALSRSMGRRGFGYVMGLTLLITLVGGAAMYAFENEVLDPNGLHSYGSALWWTSMLMTTMGSDYSPQTPEGRVLGLMLSIYAFAVFGYVTAALATFFIGRDAESAQGELPSSNTLDALRAEVVALRGEVQALTFQKTDHGSL